MSTFRVALDARSRRISRRTFEGSLARSGKAIAGRLALTLNSVLPSRAAGRFGILYYHRVGPASHPTAPLNVEPGRFEEQLTGLLDRDYTFLGLSDVLDRIEGGIDLPARAVVVTFDDGYESVFRHALPVLVRLRIPSTLFVTSAFIGTGEPFPFDPWAIEHRESVPAASWRPLSWEQCSAMVASGMVEVGTHTHTHRDFRASPEELETDLRTSVAHIGRRLGVRADLCSLPYGAGEFASASLITAARRAGVRCALTTEIRLADPREPSYGWGRLEAAASDTGASLSAKLEGWYEWMRRPRQIFDRLFK